MEIATINTIKEGVEGTITIEVEEEVEVQVINHSTINSLTSNKTSPILLLLVQDQRDQFVRFVASLDI